MPREYGKKSQCTVSRRFFTQTEFAIILGVHRVTVWKLIQEGKIRTVKIGRAEKIPIAELERLEKGTS